MATISSRTPDGRPGRCPVCGAHVTVLTAEPLEDAPCPRCGTLLWPLRARSRGDADSLYYLIADELSPAQRSRLSELLAGFDPNEVDSLDKVELVMELEELLEVAVPDEVVDEWQTLDDAVGWLQRGFGDASPD